MATATSAGTPPAKALAELNVFATSPQSLHADPASYARQVADVARWSEAAGCSGILVYTDNGIVDPWLVAQIVLQNTKELCPLVAVQPIYMHPYAVAKKVTSLAFLHNRRVFLNMVAGGFKNDLTALNDLTPHDRRYDRLSEYTLLIKQLCSTPGPVTFEGEFYQVHNLALKPPLPPELRPGVFVSGSSEAGIASAKTIGAVAMKYPEPPGESQPPAQDGVTFGIRVGLIARDDAEKAWEIAYQRFPDDRRGRLAHELAMKVSDSVWHRRLSELGETIDKPATYWLGPFQSSKTNCPYLVGTYNEVATELARYMDAGYSTYILDIPPSEEELHHTGIVFREALRRRAV